MRKKTPGTPYPPSAVTLHDVAREAGVSPSTVSRIVSGITPVHKEKREAVERAIKTLNYRPNLFARSFKTGSTMTMGVVVQDIESPFYSRAMKGIEAGLLGTDYVSIAVSGLRDKGQELERVCALMGRRIDGLIILSGGFEEAQIIEFSKRQPVAVLGRNMDAHHVCARRFDHLRGGYLATQHLLALGHREIVHITGTPGHPDATERMAGYAQALAEANIALAPERIVQGGFDEASGLHAMNALLLRGTSFSAVFAANDQCAFGARLALHRRGLRVPEDVSLVGVDDVPLSAFVSPPLTTVHQPMFEFGLFSVRAILKILGRDVEVPEPPALRLIIRETTQKK
jgi:LacI family transcriptional regulator